MYIQRDKAGRKALDLLFSVPQALPTPRPQQGPLPSRPVVEVGIGRYGNDVCVYERVCVGVWGAV